MKFWFVHRSSCPNYYNQSYSCRLASVEPSTKSDSDCQWLITTSPRHERGPLHALKTYGLRTLQFSDHPNFIGFVQTISFLAQTLSHSYRLTIRRLWDCRIVYRPTMVYLGEWTIPKVGILWLRQVLASKGRRIVVEKLSSAAPSHLRPAQREHARSD
jgi:hypothetical protein